jgi:hypothetical protein
MTPGEARYKPLSTFNTVMILISYPGLWASQEAVVPYERPILPIHFLMVIMSKPAKRDISLSLYFNNDFDFLSWLMGLAGKARAWPGSRAL